jgi:hypothetical protein
MHRQQYLCPHGHVMWSHPDSSFDDGALQHGQALVSLFRKLLVAFSSLDWAVAS